MRRVLVSSIMLTLIACGKTDSGGSPKKTSESKPPDPPAGSGAASPSEPAPAATSAGSGAASDGSEEVAQLVVHDVGSKALGSQKIEAACVSVTVVPAEGGWTVAAARLNDCGDKTARSILWVYKRMNGKWNEDYVGQPPKCWKGVPPDLARAVTIATKIQSC